MHNRIDHVVIGADTLERGQAQLARSLGVTVPRGGKHAAMSTHNCVMRTGNETFLEIIATDPEAGDPGRVRWFSLDEESVLTSPEPERLAGMLTALQVDHLARIERGPTPALAFELTGPKGRVRLD